MLYYMIAIFLSAFLLFQIQPMLGKYILPWFGGTPAVWSTSMLFYQILLLGGYAYAHWLVDRIRPRRQGMIHLGILAVSLVLLLVAALSWKSPITPDTLWKPAGDDSPIVDIFKILTAAIGLPYFILSTNSPLIQTWFSYAYPTRSPYRLYALSNIGSLLGLVTYPFLIEPALTLRAQAWLWAGLYLVFGLLVGYGAVRLLKMPDSPPQAAQAAADPLPEPGVAPSLGIRLLWVALAATASMMLLAVTSQITQEVAVIPFLWILPLTLYLLTFILTFSSERWYSRLVYGLALAIGSGFFIWLLSTGGTVGILVQIVGYSAVLFICCMICHGELVRLKPHPRYLTSFYLMVSVGGAIGGVFVNLIAPYIFSGFWELELGVVASWALLLAVFLVNPPRWKQRRKQRRNMLLVVSLLAAATFFVGYILFIYTRIASANSLVSVRNFYGVLRVREIYPDQPGEQAYQLIHGATAHGFEYLDEARRREPTAYFTEISGAGLVLLNYPRPADGLRIGILGLGIGTLAAYGQPGDTIRYYEINPAVTQLAEGEGDFFHFLQDCPCSVSVVPGDARISLERELEAGEAQQFDVLVMDTFNSDAIPVHLLTKEAFAIYMQHLQPDGVLAIHITNRHLNLLPVVRSLADAYQLAGVVVDSQGDGQRSYSSLWVLLSRNQEYLSLPAIANSSQPLLSYSSDIRLWTDDYSNLFQILK